jgi:hypothetical protein
MQEQLIKKFTNKLTDNSTDIAAKMMFDKEMSHISVKYSHARELGDRHHQA